MTRTAVVRRCLQLLVGFVSFLLVACDSGEGGPTLALVGGSVIDGTGAGPRAATVLIRGSVIEAVGAELEVPRGTEAMDITGMTVVPGLVDMHGHMYAMGGNQFEAYSTLFLAGGVTTAFSPGDFDPEGMTAFRDSVATGAALGPRILTSGPYFDHAPSVVGWIEGVESAEEALAKFEAWKDRIDVVKVYSSTTEEEIGALAEAAHANGFKMTGHLGGPTTSLRAIELGIDGLEHGIFAVAEFTGVAQDAPINDQYCSLADLDLESLAVRDLVRAIVEDDVWITPTIVTIQGIHPEFEPPTETWLDYLTPDLGQRMGQLPAYLDEEGAACLDRALANQFGFVGMVHESGGLVLAGTDPVSPKITPGFGLHAELANLVRAGLTPVEAISNATLGAAMKLGLGDRIGSVEAGKDADLVVVRGDPASDIAQIGNTVMVFKGGVRYDPAVLRESAKGGIGLPEG